MANKKRKLGAVVAQVEGYRVRHRVEAIKNSRQLRTTDLGIFKGKKEVANGFKNIEEAVTAIRANYL